MSDISSNPTQSKNSLSEIASGVHQAGLSDRASMLGTQADLSTTTQPATVGATTTGGGSIYWQLSGARITSGSASGEYANVHVMTKPEYSPSRDFVFGVLYQHHNAIDATGADFPVIGVKSAGSELGTGDHVVFHPGAGDNTDGNVQSRNAFDSVVDSAAVDYPDLRDVNYYEIAFISGNAEFRLNKSFLARDSADATINNNSRFGVKMGGHPFGIEIMGANGSSGQLLNMRAIFLQE